MLSSSFPLGRWLGIDVRVHWSVLLVAVLLGSSTAGALGWAGATLTVIGFLASILVHEFGHALVARRFGVGTTGIRLWLLGGVARLDRAAPTARAEGWIAVAGPLASIATAIAFAAGWLLAGGRAATSPLAVSAAWLAVMNAILAVFNLLPGSPLDGGRVLSAVRWARHGDRDRAAIEAGRSGVAVGWLIAAAGVGLMAAGHSGIWTLVTGMFILVAAQVEIAGARIRQSLRGTAIGDLTWYGVAHADADTDADTMLWQRSRLGAAGGVAIVDDRGEIEGVVLESAMWAVPAEDRPFVRLAQLMVPSAGLVRAAPGDDLADIIATVDLTDPLVSVWSSGRLVGLVPPTRIRDRLRTARLIP